jgi:hypothetical protein
MTITKTASAIKSDKAPRLAGTAGVVAVASDVQALCQDSSAPRRLSLCLTMMIGVHVFVESNLKFHILLLG